jgi:hypothetical protein
MLSQWHDFEIYGLETTVELKVYTILNYYFFLGGSTV